VGEAVGVPIRVHLVLGDMVCGRDADLAVRLSASASGGADAALPERILVRVPAGGYISRPFEADADATMMLTVAQGASGAVDVLAAYDLPSSCVTSGETSAAAQIRFAFEAQANAAPPPSSPLVAAPPAKASPAPPSAVPTSPPRETSSSPVVWGLGLSVVALLFWVIGRSGKKSWRDAP
jgi:hypothetical protein